jgi:hypothetical protein
MFLTNMVSLHMSVHFSLPWETMYMMKGSLGQFLRYLVQVAHSTNIAKVLLWRLKWMDHPGSARNSLAYIILNLREVIVCDGKG